MTISMPRREIDVDPARGVGQDQRLHAEPADDAGGEGHGAEIVPLVEMRAPGERGDALAAERADHQPPLVADHLRRRPVRKIAVRNRDGVLESARRSRRARTRAQPRRPAPHCRRVFSTSEAAASTARNTLLIPSPFPRSFLQENRRPGVFSKQFLLTPALLNPQASQTENAATTHSRNPAIVAVTKLASVPASMARKPRRARS